MPANKRDYYEVLGLQKGASDDDIKRAYRKMAKQYHPDVNKEPGAEEKFKEINEAYSVLSDPDKKARYDQYGFDDPTQGFGGGSGFEGFSGSGFGGFEDIFSQFFGGGSRRTNTNGPRQGADLEKTMNISFEDAVYGTKKRIRVAVEEDCVRCGGTGAQSKDDIKPCQKCKGRGRVVIRQQTIFGMSQTETVCPDCNGKGKTIAHKCPNCNGTGRTRGTKEVDLTIPAGIQTGMTLRMPGYGQSGYNGGQPGDLYITFTVEEHPNFKRDGQDIILTIPLSVAQATLGDTISVPTIDGDVSVKIPAGTQPGTKIKLRGKGTKNPKGGISRGDQYIICDVKIPTSLSKDEKKLYESLKDQDEKENTSVWKKFTSTFKRVFKQ